MSGTAQTQNQNLLKFGYVIGVFVCYSNHYFETLQFWVHLTRQKRIFSKRKVSVEILSNFLILFYKEKYIYTTHNHTNTIILMCVLCVIIWHPGQQGQFSLVLVLMVTKKKHSKFYVFWFTILLTSLVVMQQALVKEKPLILSSTHKNTTKVLKVFLRRIFLYQLHHQQLAFYCATIITKHIQYWQYKDT